jgi:uncharacterized membrane protein
MNTFIILTLLTLAITVYVIGVIKGLITTYNSSSSLYDKKIEGIDLVVVLVFGWLVYYFDFLAKLITKKLKQKYPD